MKTCECANLEWDASTYHLEHHPKCTAFIKKLETDIIQTLQDAAETLDKLRDVEPVSYEDARKLAQNIVDRATGGTFILCTVDGITTDPIPHDATPEQVEAAIDAAIAKRKREGQIFPPDPRNPKPDWWKHFEK